MLRAAATDSTSKRTAPVALRNPMKRLFPNLGAPAGC